VAWRIAGITVCAQFPHKVFHKGLRNVLPAVIQPKDVLALFF
jgi:hypothetical protein